MAPKQTRKPALRIGHPGIGQAVACQQIATAVIHHGQRITPLAIAGSKLSLEVDTPAVIGSGHRSKGLVPGGTRWRVLRG